MPSPFPQCSARHNRGRPTHVMHTSQPVIGVRAAAAIPPILPVEALRSVLLIEDDIDLQDNLRDILGLDGYCVEAVASVREALERTDWAEYQAILLDRRLPDGNADKLLPQLRQFAPRAAVIIMTGYADLESTITALRYGAADYLLKPINPDALRAVLARIAQLRAAEERAQRAERLAAIGEAMTFLAHESRNAFQVCEMSLAILEHTAKDSPEALQQVHLIRKHQQGIYRILEDTRKYAAPLTIDRRRCSLTQVWREAWELLTQVRSERQARLCEAGHLLDLSCQADPFALTQVFRNLFENALAACPDPVEITVSLTEVVQNGMPALRVALQDNGPGLSAQQRRRLFEPFFTTKPNGTGLGLTICRRIIEAHGGELGLGECKGSGAEFVIVLPRA
jgi:signal transduction histidine kinase